MKFTETELAGVCLIELELLQDERGSFARSFCQKELAEIDVDFNITQANISYSSRAGTIRGMHFQEHPFAESKIVRCTSGAIFDVAIDLRSTSETYCNWYGVEINAENRLALLVPPGCAHGFQTLSDSAEVHYLMSESYKAEAAAGVRFNDPVFGIQWPLPVASISDRDRLWPDYRQQ